MGMEFPKKFCPKENPNFECCADLNYYWRLVYFRNCVVHLSGFIFLGKGSDVCWPQSFSFESPHF